MTNIFHALVLNLHQPSGNLDYLLDHSDWEAKEILYALDRMPRILWEYEGIARVHLSLSGSLLETLSDPNFQKRVYGIVKCGDLLWHLQNTNIFEVLGTGYYHPVLPLIPESDWDEQLQQWLKIARHLFFRTDFPGFWPPEMGFCMEMIPHLRQLGYRYVMVDSHHVEPIDSMRWEEIRYRPHIAEYEGQQMIIIVRDRELSDAQESGMEYEWFEREMQQRTQWCDFPPLVTTCTDGENGGWFRNTSEDGGNFWHYFYKSLLERVRQGQSPVQPTFITEYLDRYGAHGRVNVRTGAWNTGWHHGVGFVQWTGSQMQKDALQRIRETSEEFHDLEQIITHVNLDSPEIHHQLAEARWHLLRAETSCYLYWGDAWVHRCHDDLDIVWDNLNGLSFAITAAGISRRNLKSSSS